MAADHYPWIAGRTQRSKTLRSHVTGVLPTHIPVALTFFDAHGAIAATLGLIGDGSLIAGFPVNESPPGDLAVSSVLIDYGCFPGETDLVRIPPPPLGQIDFSRRRRTGHDATETAF